MCSLKPNAAEQAFLSLGYNRFVDLFKEIESKPFWDQAPVYRFHRIRDIFAVYAELIQYAALENVLTTKRTNRPVENDLANGYFPLFVICSRTFPYSIRGTPLPSTSNLRHGNAKAKSTSS